MLRKHIPRLPPPKETFQKVARFEMWFSDLSFPSGGDLKVRGTVLGKILLFLVFKGYLTTPTHAALNAKRMASERMEISTLMDRRVNFQTKRKPRPARKKEKRERIGVVCLLREKKSGFLARKSFSGGTPHFLWKI